MHNVCEIPLKWSQQLIHNILNVYKSMSHTQLAKRLSSSNSFEVTISPIQRNGIKWKIFSSIAIEFLYTACVGENAIFVSCIQDYKTRSVYKERERESNKLFTGSS